MKLLILVGFFSSAYCSQNYGQDGIENKERRIAGGGNYGGFIGLTTYGAGPFLVNGKFEKDNNDNANVKNKDDNTNKEGHYNQEYLELYKDDDEYLEYLGYRGPRGCIEDNKEHTSNFRNINKNTLDYFDDEVKNRCDRLFGFIGPTANDDPENLIRPCALDDWQCIRKYFAANSNCKPAYGPIPDPLHININTIFIPVVNITATLPNLMIRGLSSSKIREFYVNKKSGNLVLTLDVTDLNQTIPRAYFRYRRTAKESIVLADYATIQFRAVTFTAVIPNIPHLRLDLADIHADIQDGTPQMFIGPGAANSTDLDVVTAFTQLILFLPLAIREGFLSQSQYFTSMYIQKNICDFGLELISV